MRIINTFISDGGPVPEYTKLSLKQARFFNPDIDIDFICADKQDFFDEFKINWIPQKLFSNGEVLSRFNEVCSFRRHGTPNTTYPSPELFWHRTAERIFYLLEYMLKYDLYNVFHFENDVLIYDNLELVETNEKITVTPMSRTHTTFAFCHIPTVNKLLYLCNYFNSLLEIGEPSMMAFGYDHISEMSLLNVALRKNIIDAFPITQNYKGFIYDPGSYGQYLAGTNNGHSAGFIDPSHYIGQYIAAGQIHPFFDGRPQTEYGLLFNLHVHSKNLEKFICLNT